MHHVKYLLVGVGMFAAALIGAGIVAGVAIGICWLAINYTVWSYVVVALVAAYLYGRTCVLDDEELECLTADDEDGIGVSMTKTKTKLITKAEVQAELKRIVKANPDAVNPVRVDTYDNKICLYHQGRGRNIRRCLIGQLGFNLGLPTPMAEAGAVGGVTYDGVWQDRFTPDAVEYMAAVQCAADGSYGSDPVAWGEVKI